MSTVLIANRGEIAVRIVAACRRLGLCPVVAVSAADRDSLAAQLADRALCPVVAVSAADRDSLAAQLADRALCIGPAASSASYLRPELLVEAAMAAGADVLHPGYGFCSEQPALAEACEENGIAFAGPRPETLRELGDKSSARAAAQRAEVPVAPGGEFSEPDEAIAIAAEIGYPVLIKAVHGGGGRGIHLAENDAELRRLVPVAASEARAGFGNPALYVERFYPRARHVEVQVFGDGEGGVVILGERDCSVQRRHQKLLEECPAPGLSPATRELLHSSAARLVETVAYRGAGTVEFLVDTESEADPATVVFLEVNARIQVEHPITEEAFGVDLVAAQLRLALGQPHGLPALPATPPVHVLECRLNAEDPHRGFRPSPGRVAVAEFPRGPGVRVDTHITAGALFPPYYDSLLAKLIVRAHDRDAAIDSMLGALDATRIEGVTTTADLHRHVLAGPEFRAGGVTTSWLDTEWPPPDADTGLAAAPTPAEGQAA